MLELYFLFYRIPKMMTRLAHERNRSAVVWTLIGIGAWIGAELFVGLGAGFVHGLGVALWGWSRESSGISFMTYLLALVAALLSVTVVTRILTNKQKEQEFPPPPPPPDFTEREK
ncbi:MAG TPA: hypothetical protein VE863_01065 [Pyrinomonadaceae bacterium]|nr:hypothetical protein [Pyrinomonadaceae bacterium]